MLTDWDKIEMLHKAHYRELLAEADKARLAGEALAGRDSGPPVFCRMLHWLGHRLEAWGRWLQQRFAADRPIQSLPVAQQAQ